MSDPRRDELLRLHERIEELEARSRALEKVVEVARHERLHPQSSLKEALEKLDAEVRK